MCGSHCHVVHVSKKTTETRKNCNHTTVTYSGSHSTNSLTERWRKIHEFLFLAEEPQARQLARVVCWYISVSNHSNVNSWSDFFSPTYCTSSFKLFTWYHTRSLPWNCPATFLFTGIDWRQTRIYFIIKSSIKFAQCVSVIAIMLLLHKVGPPVLQTCIKRRISFLLTWLRGGRILFPRDMSLSPLLGWPCCWNNS